MSDTQRHFEIAGAACRRMLGQRAFPRRVGNLCQLVARQFDRVEKLEQINRAVAA